MYFHVVVVSRISRVGRCQQMCTNTDSEGNKRLLRRQSDCAADLIVIQRYNSCSIKTYNR